MSLADDKKSKRGRAMRVATVFTGVAAAAVGIPQVANAQEVAHPAAKPTSKQTGRTVGPDVKRIDGSIQYYDSCGAVKVHPTWLHVGTFFYSPEGAFGPGLYPGSVCFGDAGILSSPPGTGFFGECGGNNYGYINGENKGKIVSLAFGPGKTWNENVSWSHYDDVLITKWAGTDTCKSWGGA
jgi:hypothetical protein